LPLRLGLVIDTSESITGRFSFEQRAAIDFVRQVLTGKDDLGFVIGVANSVLLVQDFTNDQQRIGHAIDQLAPAGGTALWDAVAFAAEHLAKRETRAPRRSRKPARRRSAGKSLSTQSAPARTLARMAAARLATAHCGHWPIKPAGLLSCLALSLA
jgi:von Willebrand factor type A domain